MRERKDWQTSAWWIQLQEPDLHDYTTDAAKVFRGRFRVPHSFFLELVKLAKEKKWFSRGQVDAAGGEGIPVELKVRARMCGFYSEPVEERRNTLLCFSSLLYSSTLP